MDELLPKNSKDIEYEDYADLLIDLHQFGINTRGDLQALLTKQMNAVLRADKRQVEQQIINEEDYAEGNPEEPGERLADRLDRSVFFTHVGLARQALKEEFGEDKVLDWLKQRFH